MRRLFLLFAVLFIVPLLGSGSPREFDDATVVIGIEGTWQLIESEFFFNKTRFQNNGVKTTFRNGTSTTKDSDGDTRKASYCIDSTHNPPHLDLIQLEKDDWGRKIKFIYQIDDHTLRIACSIYAANDSPRPEGFKENGICVYTYKRVK